jgi:hypothetical protein
VRGRLSGAATGYASIEFGRRLRTEMASIFKTVDMRDAMLFNVAFIQRGIYSAWHSISTPASHSRLPYFVFKSESRNSHVEHNNIGFEFSHCSLAAGCLLK